MVNSRQLKTNVSVWGKCWPWSIPQINHSVLSCLASPITGHLEYRYPRQLCLKCMRLHNNPHQHSQNYPPQYNWQTTSLWNQREDWYERCIKTSIRFLFQDILRTKCVFNTDLNSIKRIKPMANQVQTLCPDAGFTKTRCQQACLECWNLSRPWIVLPTQLKPEILIESQPKIGLIHPLGSICLGCAIWGNNSCLWGKANLLAVTW